MNRLFVLLLLAAAIRLPLLNVAGVPLFDEGVYVQSANAVLTGAPDPASDQPPLVKYVLAASIGVFGDNQLSWRLPSLLAGMAGVGLVYLVSLKLGLGRRFSFLAALLLAIDPLDVVLSRVAMLDIFMLAFSLAGVCLLLAAQGTEKLRFWLLAGVMFGLAVASKWPAVLALLGSFLFVLTEARRPRLVLLPLLSVFFVASAVYSLTYLPLMVSQGPAAFLGLQAGNVLSHSALQGGAQTSGPLEWLAGRQPVWLGWSMDGSSVTFASVALANPLAWWPALAAVFYVFANRLLMILRPKIAPLREVWRGTFRMTTAERFSVTWFFATWLPWLILPRSHTFLYYMLLVLPACYIVLASVARRSGNVRAVRALLAAAAIGLVVLYPAIIMLQVPAAYFDVLRWWIGSPPI